MEHSFVFLLLELSLILTAAKIGGLVARFLHLPVVLGELFAGVVLGNMTYLGFGFFKEVRNDSTLSSLAELGAIILMFEVGVESTVGKLFEVGWTALVVATVGVVAPLLIDSSNVVLGPKPGHSNRRAKSKLFRSPIAR